MASPSVASRPDRHHNVDPDDVVLQRAMAMSDWARRNARVIMTLAAVALVTVGGILYYRYLQHSRAASAGAAFLPIQQLAETNPAAARAQLGNFINDYEGTNEAGVARLTLAALHLSDGKPREAMTAVQPLASDAGSPLAAQASMLLGTAQEQAGDRNAALASYLQAAERTDVDYLKAQALDRAATLREQGNDFKGSAELYRRIVEMAPKGSMDRSVAEMRLAEAEARAGGR